MKDPGGRTDQLELGKERERQMCIYVYANGNLERKRHRQAECAYETG